VELNGQPWFVAKDVCLCLGLDVRAGTTNLLRNLSDDEKQRVTPRSKTLNTDTRALFGGAGMLTIISESGLYKLIMRSDKPEAKAFQDWVTRIVLPAIRKDGGYVKGEEKVASGEMSEDELVLKALDVMNRKVDQDAASAFIDGIDRYSRRIIQENGAGMQHRWMSHPMGRAMFQFRSFVAGAYTKQLLSGIHHRDLETVSSWLMSMFFGGLSYVGATYINTIGSKDRERLLAERLSPDAIGAASFSRAGFSSFMPGAADSVLKFAGYEPVFSFGRTTGLASDFFFGNPTIDAIDRAWAGGSGALQAATSSDYDFSQQDYNKVKGLLFFQNATLVRNFLNSFGDTLPRYSE